MFKFRFTFFVFCLVRVAQLFGGHIENGGIVFDSRYSTIKIHDGATLQVDYPFLAWNGTLTRESNATVEGAHITFVDGLLEDAGNQILLNAVLDPMSTLYLNDGGFFRAEPGNILQAISVSGDNNYLSGQPFLNFPITLTDAATTLTVAVQSQLNKNIVLNGGTLVLQNDLAFSDNAIITGDGEVHGNNFTVETGGYPFTWTSNINWFSNITLNNCVDFTGSFTFNAPENKIEGNGYVYDLTGGGVLTVASGSTLTLSNVVIKGIGDGAGFGQIVLTDDTSTLVLTNVTFLFSDNYTTSQGKVEAKGPNTAVVRNFNWLFNGTSELEVDNLTLWKDVAGAIPCGDIIFASLATNRTLLNDGTIDYITLRCTSIVEELDSALEVNDSRIDLLESAVEVNDSRIDLNESCCEINDSRIDVLESRVDEISVSDEVDSRLDLLESCCEINDSRIDVLESQIDEISVTDEVDSRLDLLESCCEINDSRIDVLESRIDTISTETCITRICSDVQFDLSMLPGFGETRVFEFCKCNPCKCSNPEDNAPRVIFDPAVYGNGGRVVLPKESTLMFTGCGTVELKDGVIFELDGTPFGANRNDWPQLILDGGAQMVVEAGGTATVGGGTSGAGCFIIRQGSSVFIDNASAQLIFGETVNNEILVLGEIASHMTVDNVTALISFHLGTFDVIFDNNSALQALQGTIEMNTLNSAESPGVIRLFEFHNDSALVIPGVCGQSFGLLRLAPNIDDANVAFNNLTGHVVGNGDIQYVRFDNTGTIDVNSVIRAQDNKFDITQPMVNTFIELGYILEKGLMTPPDATILATQGSRPTASECGRLVAFCPSINGSIVGLSQGDHDVFYDRSVSCSTLDLVRGYDRLGRVFTISDCDASTRTPAAPPVT